MINRELEGKLKSGDEFASLLFNKHSETVIFSFVNPFSYGIVASKLSIVNSVDYWFADGALLCFLSNLIRVKRITRASFDFSSIASEVFSFASVGKKRIAFVGGREEELDLAISGIRCMYPLLNVVGKFSGFFEWSDARLVAYNVSLTMPDILIVGMGTPMQEEFSSICRDAFGTPCMIFTCGGFISQSAIKSDYYHPVIKRLGLRWLQRAYDFKHVRKRLIFDYPFFFFGYLTDALKAKLRCVFKFGK